MQLQETGKARTRSKDHYGSGGPKTLGTGVGVRCILLSSLDDRELELGDF